MLIAYSYRGLNMNSMGMGGCYRRLRSLILSEFVMGEITIVGNGASSVTDAHPLEVKLVETGQGLGHMDWATLPAKRDTQMVDIVNHAVKAVKKYLATPFAMDTTTNTLKHPGRFRGSGSFSNLHLPAVKGKKKKGKKK